MPKTKQSSTPKTKSSNKVKSASPLDERLKEIGPVEVKKDQVELDPVEKKQFPVRLLVVVIVAAIIGIGLGSLYYYFFVPRPNPDTAVSRNFKIDDEGFEKVDLGVTLWPNLNEEKLTVAENLFYWLVEQLDWRGVYAAQAECTYSLADGSGSCTNPSFEVPDFVSNRSFQAPVWGMFKLYQNTGDGMYLDFVESDLQVVKHAILDQPDLYYIQNDDYSCVYLKDLYFSSEVSDEGKEIIRQICTQAEYEVTYLPVEGVNYDETIMEKVSWLANGEFSAERVQASYSKLGLSAEEFDFYVKNTTDFRTMADMIIAQTMDVEFWGRDYVKSQMDLMLTEYAYLLNQSDGVVSDYYNSGLVMALVYYERFMDGDQSTMVNLAREVYNQSFQSGEMSVDDMLDYALVQYHLGYPMSQIQSNLLNLYYATEHNNFGGLTPKYYQYPGTVYVDEALGTVSSVGDIKQNGLIMGVLAI